MSTCVRLLRLTRRISLPFLAFIPAFLLAQESPANLSTPAPGVTTILTQTSQAFSAGKTVASVEMTGTAHWYVGVANETDSGPAKLSANENGENRAEFDFSSGTRIEALSAIADGRTCTWSGKDGVSHDMASSNCWTATVWFLPHLALQSAGLPPAVSMQSLPADKTHSSPYLRHQLTIAPGATKPEVTALIRSWSTTDLILEPATNLPSILKYNIHPDNHSSVNLQVEVRYSNYKSVSGVQLPMHIERRVNGSLQVSIDIESAVVN